MELLYCTPELKSLFKDLNRKVILFKIYYLYYLFLFFLLNTLREPLYIHIVISYNPHE